MALLNIGDRTSACSSFLREYKQKTLEMVERELTHSYHWGQTPSFYDKCMWVRLLA